ncbi:hypothetical protein [Actinokineospora globicatena]|uniref:Uncharacterized protein n=1 Tax=Actinokineospora globicatena TaxID=103729 RepID=A0A9W6VA60_9PSEU|nr:hypothetical protein [Actinokineospora globicatena]GLW93992.1 hypothetical protein Aglo03_48080 [Actinokineospora globicatena]
MSPVDPTARAAIHSGDNDVLGSALMQLDGYVADFIVLQVGFKVHMTNLVRLFIGSRARRLHGYDYLRHVRGSLAFGHRQLREFLHDHGFTPEDLDWHSSRAVREIGARYGVDHLRACGHCHQLKIPVLRPRGRPREYCSSPCRQAAYRRRQSDPAAVAAARDDPNRAMVPCFAGIERSIPIKHRFELIELERTGAIQMEQVALEEGDSANPPIEALLARRWSSTSPLIRAARAGLAYLLQCGADLDRVFLHGQDTREQMTPHSVGFNCRYLRAMRRVFAEFGGVEWLEIPRPSRNGRLVGLRIQALDRDQLTAFTPRPS